MCLPAAIASRPHRSLYAFRFSLNCAAVIVALVLCTSVAAAQTFFVAPPSAGDDRNDCSSPTKACATFQHAVNLCPSGGYCSIYAAEGVYYQRTTVMYYKIIHITGPLDKDGHCIDRNSVTIIGKEPEPILFVQDHAILAIQCMTLSSTADRTIGFAARQFAIGDINDVDFLQFPEGLGVAANEASKVNIFNPGIQGNASRFASANKLSQIGIQGIIRMNDSIRFDVAFVSSTFNSIVSVRPSEIIGGKKMSGASYLCDRATIEKDVVLPGGDLPYDPKQDCILIGFPADELHRSALDWLGARLDDKWSREIQSTRHILDEKWSREMRAMRAKAEGEFNSTIMTLHTELNKANDAVRVLKADNQALNAEIQADRKKRRRHDRLSDTLMAALITVLVVAVGYTTIVRWRRGRYNRQMR